MNNKKYCGGSVVLAAFGLFVVSVTPVRATTVTYDLTNLTGTTWAYTYNVTNDTLVSSIDEFTIFFDVNLYANLAVDSTPASWDPIVIQPDTAIPDDGFYDALALSTGIAPGDSLGGFSVQFDFLGAGIPGEQFFDVVDPTTFASLDSGLTQASAVPLPAAIGLFASGLAFFSAFELKSRRGGRHATALQ